MEHEIEPRDIDEISDLVYSISNLCATFVTVRDCAPNSLKLMPTILEEIYCKSQQLAEFCVEKG